MRRPPISSQRCTPTIDRRTGAISVYAARKNTHSTARYSAMVTVVLLALLLVMGYGWRQYACMGSYVCVAVEQGQTRIGIDQIYPNGASLQLYKQGKGNLGLDGSTVPVTWSLDVTGIQVQLENTTIAAKLGINRLRLTLGESDLVLIMKKA